MKQEVSLSFLTLALLLGIGLRPSREVAEKHNNNRNR